MANKITRFLLDGTEYQFQDERLSTIDTEVTEGSSNVVTSGAVASYVDAQLGVVADGSY